DRRATVRPGSRPAGGTYRSRRSVMNPLPKDNDETVDSAPAAVNPPPAKPGATTDVPPVGPGQTVDFAPAEGETPPLPGTVAVPPGESGPAEFNGTLDFVPLDPRATVDEAPPAETGTEEAARTRGPRNRTTADAPTVPGYEVLGVLGRRRQGRGL